MLEKTGINLARAQLLTGNVSAAKAALEQARPVLSGLSAAGWALFGGSGAMLQQVRDLREKIREPLELKFLGYREQLNRIDRISLRGREILLLLACHPEGQSGDRLTGLLDLDKDKHTGMRTGLTRLKERYPIHSRPYRLAVEARTDFQLLLELDPAGARGGCRQVLRGSAAAGTRSCFRDGVAYGSRGVTQTGGIATR